MAEAKQQAAREINEGTNSVRLRAVRALPGEAGGPLEEHSAWPILSRLPVRLAVSIPLKNFKVKELLDLRPGRTVESAWAVTEDVPLKTGNVLICWGEFEVLEQQMALRLTRLP